MLDIILIILFGMAIGWIAKRYKFPAAVGYVLLGLLIGPPLLGLITPDETQKHIGDIGVLLLLGAAGFRLGVRQLFDVGWAGFWTAFLGMLLCFVCGYLFTLWWGSSSEESIYVGTALTATSIGISVQVLGQFGLIEKKIGQIIIAAAVIDDIVALYLLALAHGVLTDGVDINNIATSIIIAALLLMLIFAVCKVPTHTTFHLLGLSRVFRFSMVIVAILIFGWFSQWMGYSLVVGGFFAGLGLGEGIRDVSSRDQIARWLDGLVLVLVPFFFVLIGAQAEWKVLADDGMVVLLIGLLVVAILGKVLGGFIGSAGGRYWTDRILIGASMAPRGEVALIIASLGFQQGHISHHMLVALILMTIGSAVISPLFVMLLARYAGSTTI